MDQARWERIQSLFHGAADLPAPERRAFLEARGGDDPTLVAEVLAMLEEDARLGSVLDRGVARVAKRMLDEPIPRALREQRFGPYRIRRVLGEGGMGVVYLAEREDLQSVAALKILRDASLSPSRRDRFAAEQRTLAQLHHPAIAQLYDADTLPDGTPWFVMEYVEGVPLTEYCRARQTSLRGRLILFRGVCEAVQHAHRQAVIHRDIKPSNLLVKDDGTVKLLDFGIAKQLESLDQAAEQTRTGLRLMTPAYAAPEQIRGGRVGTYTDVYALGVVLYELLAGRLPFEVGNRSAGEVEAIVAGKDPERPSAAARGDRPDVPAFARGASRSAWADLDVLCLTAMHKEPERRYRTVDALIRDIDHFLAGEPLDARPDTWGYRLGKFARRNRQPVAAGVAAVVVLVALVAFYTVRLATARNAALAEAARTQRIQGFMLDLFQGGEDEVSPAESLRVLTLVDRGWQEARTLDREPAVQAEMFGTLGGVYQKLGKLARADTLLRAARDQRRALFGADHPDVAKSVVALALLRADQAEFDEAERLAREGLAMTRRHRPPDHPDVTHAITALGRVLEEGGRYDEAIAVLDEAVGLLSAPGDTTPDLAQALYGLANNHFYAGHYQVSDSLNRVVLAMSRRLYGDRHPNVADDLINLGAVQQELGNYVQAERYHRQALDIVRSWYGDDHPETAASLTMVGRALFFQARHDEALALLRQSLAVQERVYGPVHPRVASALNEIAGIAYQQDRYDEAETAYNRVIGIYRTVYPAGHYYIGIALANLAGVFQARREHPRAEALFREALAIYARTLEPDHLNVGIGRIKLGRVLLRQRRFAEAVVETRAGYDILVKEANPAVSFLRAARSDLVAAYDSLSKPELAARFRAELADTVKK
jgi:serine/threonine-protein kinase